MRHVSDVNVELHELVTRVQNGEDPENAFRQLFDRYAGPLSHFFANRGFTREECHDLIQETFLGAFENIRDYRAEARFESWLFGIASNLWKSRLRRRYAGKRRGPEIPIQLLLGEGHEAPVDDERLVAGESGDSLGRMIAEERQQALRQALLDLPPQMRQCVFMRLDQDLKYREIADIMGVAVNTVKSQLAQAKERLRKNLATSFTELEV